MLASVRYGDNKIRSGWLLLALLTTPELRRVLSSICAPLATLPVDELTEILPSLDRNIAGSAGAPLRRLRPGISHFPVKAVRRFPTAGRTVNPRWQNTVRT